MQNLQYSMCLKGLDPGIKEKNGKVILMKNFTIMYCKYPRMQKFYIKSLALFWIIYRTEKQLILVVNNIISTRFSFGQII